MQQGVGTTGNSSTIYGRGYHSRPGNTYTVTGFYLVGVEVPAQYIGVSQNDRIRSLLHLVLMLDHNFIGFCKQ